MPWEVVRTTTTAATNRSCADRTVCTRVEWKFYCGELRSVAALQLLKAPTAQRGIRNVGLESGTLFPVNHQLTDKIIVTIVPGLDSLKDGDNSGHHMSTAQLVNVGFPLPAGPTGYAEMCGDWNVDPARTLRRLYPGDAALASGVSKTLQLDSGLNAGRNRATSRVQAYTPFRRTAEAPAAMGAGRCNASVAAQTISGNGPAPSHARGRGPHGPVSTRHTVTERPPRRPSDGPSIRRLRRGKRRPASA